MSPVRLTVAFLIAALAGGCSYGVLRGKSVRSPDGRTYLVVDDDNGGGRGPILVDGRKWPYPIHSAGLIEPGLHKIDCGGALTFEIKPGTTFHFNYWGP